VENRGGAGATIGTEAVAKATADGYTLLLGINAGIVIAPHIYPKLGYDPLKDLAPIAAFAISPMLMVVPANSPVKTVQDFVALAAVACKALPARGAIRFGLARARCIH
jgi:tripartite-type tricarboxylate transporter receptor subunit TctC